MMTNATSTHDNDSDFQEVLQGALVRAWQNEDFYDPRSGEYRRWLYRVAQRYAIDQKRRRGTNKEKILIEAQQTKGVADNDVGPTDKDWLKTCLSLLPDDDRELLIDYCSGNRGKKEVIAAKHGISYPGLASKVYRLKWHLREAMSSISEEDRELLIRWCSPVVDNSEAARKYGCTVHELAKYIDDIREQLRAKLGQGEDR